MRRPATAASIVYLDSRTVEDELQRAQALIAGYDEQLAAELPEGIEIFDAHVHLGNDIDGFSGVYDELERITDRYGIARCFVFCMDEADRHPAFQAANDRTLGYARRSNGRLIPFARLDLGERPVVEATRCLNAGARGIKLHPRAQRFLLNDQRLAPVFALAAERRVPILIHGGRGLPPIADHPARLVGFDEDALRGLLWENANRIASGEPPREPSPPLGGGTFSQPMAFARIHQYLSMATPLLWTRQADTIGVLGLALNACADRDGHAEERDRIRDLLLAARELWRSLPELEDEAEQRIVSRTTFRLVHLADILAVTSGA